MVEPCQLPSTELFTVENFKHLDSFLQLGGHSDGGEAGVGERPGALLQHSDEVVDADLGVGVGQERRELVVQILRSQNVREHTVEFGCELVPTGLLQPVDHGLLHVHAVGHHVDQSLAERPGVKFLEYILKVETRENNEKGFILWILCSVLLRIITVLATTCFRKKWPTGCY